MEPLVLSDANIYPSEDVIFSHIGKSKPLWISFFKQIEDNHSDFTKEWRYYQDGKSWLLKVVQKKKTIFWLSIIKDSFRTTFYFTDKAEEAIQSSALSAELKEQFKSGKRYNKIRGVTVVHGTKKALEDAKLLIEIKLRIK
jgi:hypothetical protein